MNCFDEATLHSYVDDVLTVGERQRVHEHVLQCANCATQVTRVRGLRAALSTIDMRAEPGHDLWPGIASRTTRRTASPALLRLAASIALFATGFAVGGLAFQSRSGPTPSATNPTDVLVAAEEVQRTGSAYIAALANLAVAADAVTDSTRARAVRDVAFASLRGATLELVRIAPAEGADLYRTAVENHSNIQSGHSRITRF